MGSYVVSGFSRTGSNGQLRHEARRAGACRSAPWSWSKYGRGERHKEFSATRGSNAQLPQVVLAGPFFDLLAAAIRSSVAVAIALVPFLQAALVVAFQLAVELHPEDAGARCSLTYLARLLNSE